VADDLLYPEAVFDLTTARAVAAHVVNAVGGEPEVRRIHDRGREHFVDVLHCDDRPEPGWTTFSTVTLHAAPNLLEGQDIRVELAAVGSSVNVDLATMLANIGLGLVKEGWLCAPGVAFRDAALDSGVSEALPHLMLTPPFPWSELGAARLSDVLTVHWLLGVPIYASEYAFLLSHGFNELEALFARSQMEYLDLARPPVV
jgi:hypothetical protein